MGFPCLFWNPALLSGIRLCAPGGGNGRGALDSESSEVRRETSGSQSRPPGEGDLPGEMVVWWVYSGRTPRSRGADPTGFPRPVKMYIHQLLKGHGGLDDRHLSREGVRTPRWGTPTERWETPHTNTTESLPGPGRRKQQATNWRSLSLTCQSRVYKI